MPGHFLIAASFLVIACGRDTAPASEARSVAPTPLEPAPVPPAPGRAPAPIAPQAVGAPSRPTADADADATAKRAKAAARSREAAEAEAVAALLGGRDGDRPSGVRAGMERSSPGSDLEQAVKETGPRSDEERDHSRGSGSSLRGGSGRGPSMESRAAPPPPPPPPAPTPSPISIELYHCCCGDACDAAERKLEASYRAGLEQCMKSAKFLGTAELELTVDATGAVDWARVQYGDAIAACVEARARTWHLSPATDGKLHITVRLRATEP